MVSLWLREQWPGIKQISRTGWGVFSSDSRLKASIGLRQIEIHWSLAFGVRRVHTGTVLTFIAVRQVLVGFWIILVCPPLVGINDIYLTFKIDTNSINHQPVSPALYKVWDLYSVWPLVVRLSFCPGDLQKSPVEILPDLYVAQL